MGAVLPGFHPFRPGNTACGAAVPGRRHKTKRRLQGRRPLPGWPQRTIAGQRSSCGSCWARPPTKRLPGGRADSKATLRPSAARPAHASPGSLAFGHLFTVGPERRPWRGGLGLEAGCHFVGLELSFCGCRDVILEMSFCEYRDVILWGLEMSFCGSRDVILWV